MVNVFEFQDYREYLRCYYDENKRTKPYFSYRYFSEKAGINASAFLYYVIKGKRNLTKKSSAKVSMAIAHSKEEAEYFENLVFFNQAESITEKTYYYSKLVNVRRPIDINTVDKNRYEFYSKWYYSIVRELIGILEIKDNHKLIGEYIVPKITNHQVEEAVSVLLRLQFIKRDEDGVLRQTDNLIQATPDITEIFIMEKFHVEMLQMAIKSYDIFSRNERLAASTTFRISKNTFELFKMKTREFRKELLEIARLDNEPEQVYQFTFNLFPMSKDPKDE